MLFCMFRKSRKFVTCKNQILPGSRPHGKILTEGDKGSFRDIFAASAEGAFTKIYFALLTQDGILRTDGGTLPDCGGIARTVYLRQATKAFIKIDWLFWVLGGFTTLLITVSDDFQHILYLGYCAADKRLSLLQIKAAVGEIEAFVAQGKIGNLLVSKRHGKPCPIMKGGVFNLVPGNPPGRIG